MANNHKQIKTKERFRVSVIRTTSPSVSRVAIEAPLRGPIMMKGATEFPTYSLLEAVVVLTWNSSSVWSKRAASVNHCRCGECKGEAPVRTVLGSTRCMSTDICLVHWQAMTVTNVRHDIEVAELVAGV